MCVIGFAECYPLSQTPACSYTGAASLLPGSKVDSTKLRYICPHCLRPCFFEPLDLLRSTSKGERMQTSLPGKAAFDTGSDLLHGLTLNPLLRAMAEGQRSAG